MEVPDVKAQRVLLNGVHQDIFESFIYEVDRTPYVNYRALVTALKAVSAKPRMSAKLAVLKPGRVQIMTAVSAAHLSPQESRLTQIESVLVALGNASLSAGSNKNTNNNNTTSCRPSESPCWWWEKGKYNAGDSCRFSHSGGKGQKP